MTQLCKSNTWLLLSIALALVIGYFVGSYCSKCDVNKVASTEAIGANSVVPSNFASKSQEDLTSDLSAVMLPQDEYLKLMDAIEQTALGLLNAQAQGQNFKVTPEVEDKLKGGIKEKYSRKYFTSINAETMKDLTKPELVDILNFYASASGMKIRELTPKIIQETMQVVQKDLSVWLPSTVTQLIKNPNAPLNQPVAKDEKALEEVKKVN